MVKAAKSISGEWILLKFVRETRTKPPTSPPMLLCCSCWFQFTSFWIKLRSSAKRETDVPEITTVLPASDSLFGTRLIFQQSYLTWSDYILIFNGMGTEKPRIRKLWNTLCKHLMIRRRRYTILPSYTVFMWTIEQFQDCKPSLLIQQHKGKEMLC